MPTLKKAGRPRRVVTDSEEREILGIYMKCPTNAVAIECMLKKKRINLGYNIIHSVLKKHRLAVDQKGKQKRKKWIKYEGSIQIFFGIQTGTWLWTADGGVSGL